MSKPTTGHTANFRQSHFQREPDGRICARTVERNAKPIIDGLSPFLADLTGHALEIGSGTGQHILEFSRAFPTLTWTPSEPDETHRASINAWRDHSNAPSRDAIALDAAAYWADQPELAAIRPLSLILSLNVIHISPFTVTKGIVAGAVASLKAAGLLAFYGPFRENGKHTGPGNQTFDARLRADNPDWGVRDVDDLVALGQVAGLQFKALLEMPANNRLLILKKNPAD